MTEFERGQLMHWHFQGQPAFRNAAGTKYPAPAWRRMFDNFRKLGLTVPGHNFDKLSPLGEQACEFRTSPICPISRWGGSDDSATSDGVGREIAAAARPRRFIEYPSGQFTTAIEKISVSATASKNCVKHLRRSMVFLIPSQTSMKVSLLDCQVLGDANPTRLEIGLANRRRLVRHRLDREDVFDLYRGKK